MESQPTAHDRDLIGLEGMPAEVIRDLLDTASAFESGFRGDELSRCLRLQRRQG